MNEEIRKLHRGLDQYHEEVVTTGRQATCRLISWLVGQELQYSSLLTGFTKFTANHEESITVSGEILGAKWVRLPVFFQVPPVTR